MFDGRTGLSLVALAGSLLTACGGGPTSDHVTLDRSIEALRPAFEADSGKVRAIFLASPT